MADQPAEHEPSKVVSRLRLVRRISLVLCGLILAAVVAFVAKERLSQTSGKGPTLPQVKIGGPFSLTDHDGRPVTEKDFQGKFLIVFFGYTFCPDVCPTTLADVSAALDRLGPDAGKFQPLFITVDPARDTAPRLKEYVGHFNPRIRGLTGTEAQIKEAAKAFRAYYVKAKADGGGPNDYLMDHSSIVYVIGPEGGFKIHFSHGTDADTMAAKLKTLL
ncbi:MAG: SCO family protein [Rhodospirillaceae bacterium]